MIHQLLVLLIPAFTSLGASERNPAAWVNALRQPSSAPSAVPDIGDYGTRGGTLDAKEEARLLAPFGTLTTEEARVAVPLLLAMLEERTGVFANRLSGEPYEVRNRAWEALFRVSFRRIGRFHVNIGCMMSDEGYERVAKEEKEALLGWPRWWQENRGREIAAWRGKAVGEMMAALRMRAEFETAAQTAMEKLSLLGNLGRGFLRADDLKLIAEVADDASVAPMLRCRCISALLSLEEEKALARAEGFVTGDSPSYEARTGVLWELEQEGARGIPSLLSIARQLSGHTKGPPKDLDATCFIGAVQAVQRLSGEHWMEFVPQSVEGRMKVVLAMEQWWTKRKPQTR